MRNTRGVKMLILFQVNGGDCTGVHATNLCHHSEHTLINVIPFFPDFSPKYRETEHQGNKMY